MRLCLIWWASKNNFMTTNSKKLSKWAAFFVFYLKVIFSLGRQNSFVRGLNWIMIHEAGGTEKPHE